MRFPLLPVAAAFAAGLALWRDVLDSPQALFGLSLAAMLSGVLALRRDALNLSLALALTGFFLLGGALVRFEAITVAPNRLDKVATSALDLDYAVRVRGWVTARPEAQASDYRFSMEAETVQQGAAPVRVRGMIRVYYRITADGAWFDGFPPLEYGDRVEVLLRLRRPRRYANPGSFDWPEYLERQEIYLEGSLRSALLLKRLPNPYGNRIAAFARRVRLRLLTRIDEVIKPGNTRGALHAMLLGERNLLHKPLREKFRLSGAYHVLVISGLHVAMIAVTLFWILRVLLVPERLAMPAIVLVLVFYLLMVEDRPSTERAVWMVSLYLLARLFYRDVHLGNPTGLAALLMLFLHPLWLFDSAFQFTFGAVLLIAFLGLPWIACTSEPYRGALSFLHSEAHDDQVASGRLAQFRLDLRALAGMVSPAFRWSVDPVRMATAFAASAVRIGLRAWDFLVLSFAIHLGFIVLIPFHFQQMVWTGLPASVLTVPLVAWIVPLGLAGIVVPVAGEGLLMLAAMITGWLIALVERLAGWPLSYSLPPPPLWLLLAYLGGLVLLARATHRQRGRAVVALFMIPCAVLVATHPFPPDLSSDGVQITFLDVGQGDSIFLSFSGGEKWLVDGGAGPYEVPNQDGEDAPPDLRGQDIGRMVVGQYLREHGIKRLDRVWLTHAHRDHISGLESVLEDFKVGSLDVSRPTVSRERFGPLFEVAQRRGVRVKMHSAGESFDAGRARVSVLWPPPDYIGSEKEVNNDSLVLRICLAESCLLLTGDIQPEIERQLVSREDSLRADVLKVPHHGGIGAATRELLAAVRPDAAVISAGKANPHGHPRPETLDRLAAAGARVFRTNRDGAVTMVMTGHDIRAETFAESQPPLPETNIFVKLHRLGRELLQN